MQVNVSELSSVSKRKKQSFGTSAFDQSKDLVLGEEESLRDLQGLCQTAEAELDKARRIIEAEARIDDRDQCMGGQQASIVGRVVGKFKYRHKIVLHSRRPILTIGGVCFGKFRAKP